MNNYIFLFSAIGNIGGAQLYLVNKIHYLRERGWNVDVYYGRRGPLLIEELKEFEANYYACLRFSTCYYRDSYVLSQAKHIAERIKNKSGDGQTVIESCTACHGLWGELIAKELNCKHICFSFEELFDLSKSQQDFVYYKYKKHEIAGIRKQSVDMMLKGSGHIIDNPEYYIAYPVPTIGDVPMHISINKDNYDKIIGSLGRLDKGFVWTALTEIRDYIDKHREKKYAIVLIGDTKDNHFKQSIYDLFKGVADLFVTGEVWPVSRDLVKLIDVFVSSSGSATTTAKEFRPTIAISPSTFKPNGILDYTTKNAIFSPEPDKKTIAELIEDILDNDFCKNNPRLGMYENYWENYQETCKKEFERQEEIALETVTDYYDIFKIRKTGKRGIVALYGKLVGSTLFETTIDFLQNNIGTLIKG